MYLEQFGFVEKPFHITPNPRFIFLSQNHKEAFAHLLYGIQQRVGFLSLTGEIGTGKTTVLRTLLQQLTDAEYRVALIFNPCLNAIDLLVAIHREFSIECSTSHPNLLDLHDSLNQFLLQQREAGKTVVLVIDEAQNLDPMVLEQLRLLSNLETETDKLIQMVLVGQPELDVLLQRDDLRQLRQRLVVSYRLLPMSGEDTQSYVRHRVKIAGTKEQELFSPKALAQIYQFTRGTPRLINILCDRSLLVAYGRDSHSVAKSDVLVAQKELRHQHVKPTRKRMFLFGGMLVLLLFLALVIRFVMFPVREPAAVAGNTEVREPVIAPELELSAEIAMDEDSSRAYILAQHVADILVEESGLQTVLAVAERWQLNRPDQIAPVSGRKSLLQCLGEFGLDVILFQGTLSNLLQFDVPVVLEVTLPNMVGKRFLTIVAVRDAQVKTVPAITPSGWLTAAELEQLWFGKALVPYVNYLDVPAIYRPWLQGEFVASVQQLLNLIDKGGLNVSGVYDRQTIGSVTRFQQRMNLAPDGRVGAITLFWLYREAGNDMPRLLSGESP